MKLLTGDITKIETDAIVNAASPDLRRSPGICDAIFAAADTRALTAACKKLRRCPVGTAVVTPSFGLPCKYIIHVALGEWMGDLRTGKRLMEACYRHAMQQALMCRCRTLAFPLVFSGAFHLPRMEALTVAEKAILKFEAKHPELDVSLVLYPPQILAQAQAVLRQLCPEN